MFERLQKLLDRIESRIALWTIIQGTGIVSGGIISGWIASAEVWIGSYGTLGWWFAGLLGALITALVLVSFAGLRYMWIRASALRQWKERVTTFNPLAREFRSQRLSIHDLADPGRQIVRKRFIDCELMGPANIFLHGGTATGVHFHNCDFVVVPPPGRVHNVIAFPDPTIIGGSIWNCTIMITLDMLGEFAAANVNFITLTGDKTIDERRGDKGVTGR